MIVHWLFRAALTVLGWVLSALSFLPVIVLPASPSLHLVVPVLGVAGAASMTTWITSAVAVGLALVAGKALQWLYDKIPFKGT